MDGEHFHTALARANTHAQRQRSAVLLDEWTIPVGFTTQLGRVFLVSVPLDAHDEREDES